MGSVYEETTRTKHGGGCCRFVFEGAEKKKPKCYLPGAPTKTAPRFPTAREGNDPLPTAPEFAVRPISEQADVFLLGRPRGWWPVLTNERRLFDGETIPQKFVAAGKTILAQCHQKSRFGTVRVQGGENSEPKNPAWGPKQTKPIPGYRDCVVRSVGCTGHKRFSTTNHTDERLSYVTRFAPSFHRWVRSGS